MTADTVSPEEIEMTRTLGARNYAELLRAVSRTTQAHAAACMGLSASTVSRRLEEQAEDFCLLLAAVGLQFASPDAMVVDPDEQQACMSLALKYLESQRQLRLRKDGAK